MTPPPLHTGGHTRPAHASSPGELDANGPMAPRLPVWPQLLAPGEIGRDVRPSALTRHACQFDEQLPTGPDGEYPMPLPDLNNASCHRRLGGQSIQDPIVGEVAVPTDFALFRREAVPGEGLRQGGEGFLLPTIDRTFVSGSMHPCIALLTPGEGLAIEIIQIGKRNAWPEVVLDHSDRALDLALRLGRSRFADPWRHPDGGHEIGKTGVPVRNLVHHLQEHTFHAVCERCLG